MRDQQINSFYKGMQKDLGNTMPQEGLYTHAENVRVTTSGGPGESAILVNVKGNKQVLDLKFTVSTSTIIPELDKFGRLTGKQIVHTSIHGELPCEFLGYTVIRNTLIIFSNVRYMGAFPTNALGGVGFSGTNAIHTVELDDLSTPTLIYDNKNLNFRLSHPIKAIGRYESEAIQRIYFTDNKNPVRSLNIKDPNIKNLTVDKLDLNPPVNFGSPRIVKVETVGNLPAGMYQYAYRLKSEGGKTTRFSPLSNFVHIVKGSAYWEYEPDPEAQTEYSSTEPGEETNKSVEIKITNLDIEYDVIEVAAVHKTNENSIDSGYIIETTEINSSTLFFTHKDNTGAALLPEEITAISNTPSKVKTLATKDNRLFLGNIGYSIFDLEFNARAYRFKRPDGVLYPRLSLSDTSGVANEGTTYVDFDFDPINQDNFSKYTLEENLNAINPYNLEIINPIGNDAYKFQKNGITLGGEGPNIVYRFIKKRIDGNTLRSIPDSAPFVKAGFKNSANDNATIDPYNAGGVNGDYKSAITANEMVGYRRNEIYRFGVVLYDLQGNPGFVNWIGDIKFPDYKDYDHEEWNSGLRNFTIGQAYGMGSGANYHFNNGEVDAYANMGNNDPSVFDGSVSQLKTSEVAAYTDTAGDLFALGIQFQINIPEEIQDKISGYKVVRVERTERDKTIVGSGILNYMHSGIDTSDDDKTLVSFGWSPNEKQIGGLSEAQQYNNGYGTPLGYNGGDTTAYDKILPYVFSIDSPDWAFEGYPSLSDEMYVSVDGSLIGDKKYGFLGSNEIASAGVFTSHILSKTSDTLEYNFPLTFASKLERAEESQVIAEINDELGVFNRVYHTNSAAPAWASVGEETLLCAIPDQIPDFEPGAGNHDLDRGIRWDYFLDGYRAFGGRGKLLATVRRNLKGNQYGGNTQTSRTFNKYISAGPFISMDNSEYIDSNFNTHEVWGGDTYVVMYDIEKMRRKTSLDSGSTTLTSATIRPESVSFAFPVESSVNTALRSGWHFANKEDWSDDSSTQLNTFDLNGVYSSENKTQIFIPKPLNFTEVSSYDNRVLYSDAKINNATQDSWTNFKTENYKDLDGNKGAISSLVLFKDNLYFLQETGFGGLSISPTSAVIDQSGTSIVLGTGDVIQDFEYISNTVGNTNNKSVVSTEKGIYWVDSNLKKIYAFRANGLESLSDVHGMKSWAYNKIENLDTNLSSGYDSLNDEVLFSIGENKTLVFNELLNKFTSFYNYSTKYHISTKNALFSIHYDSNSSAISSNDIMYEHNKGGYGEWYKNANQIVVEFIVNKNPMNAKVFDSIEWFVQNNNGTDLSLDNNFNSVSFEISSPSYKTTVELTQVDEEGKRVIVEDSDFDVRENISRMPVPRMQDESRFRDSYMKVRLISTGNRTADKIMLHYVKTLFRISRR